jgi:hypothetical protein
MVDWNPDMTTQEGSETLEKTLEPDAFHTIALGLLK